MSSETTGARVCFTSRVRADRIPEYRAAHAAVWPEMLEALRDTGWRDYRLFLRDDGLLVGILETDDYAAARRGMAATEVNARWQAAMSGRPVHGPTKNAQASAPTTGSTVGATKCLRLIGSRRSTSTHTFTMANTASSSDVVPPRAETTSLFRSRQTK